MGGDADGRELGAAAGGLDRGQASFALADHSGQEREAEKAMDRLAPHEETLYLISSYTPFPEPLATMISFLSPWISQSWTGASSGAQSIPNGSPTHGEGTHSEEEGFAVDDEDSDGDLNTWELSEGVSDHPPKEQAADLFNEDWDLELKADQGNPYDADDIQGCISQEVKPWVCCAPQGDMVYDPSWHHPPPLIPHYSKMVFETGQFDDAED
ncbi:LOW QUALITY PROTEIN: coordinator of PRMT5 and differentiation stimulator [Lontra canadensis]|uniref:LOW QUALITY PROTEIN: coordinator of PRMT5 and differentiation stimulator n=1 Tax=Lontra canadensis TaxID=76717 RepID=UPI0013F2D87B|nr:LOW QUALITY PROTEIN: coordinator of PRMT5 and differentiation stimulator [Lontra canadensis]